MTVQTCRIRRVAANVRQSRYRETLLALRSVVGARELDAFLAGKDDLIEELGASVRDRADSLGLDVVSVGNMSIVLGPRRQETGGLADRVVNLL